MQSSTVTSTSSSNSSSTIQTPNSILYGGGKNKGAVSLADLLERRTHGLTEPETWALLCQAVQALQDLFLSDSCSVGRCVPLVTPGSFLVTPRGRVSLPTSRRLTATPPQTAYLAPEYRPGKNFTDTESEKMWIFSLGETLTRTALTNHCAVTHLTPALCRALSAMTRRNPTQRANLMCLLDVISDYCKSRIQTKPFSHIVMDLHREVMGPTLAIIGTPPNGTALVYQQQYNNNGCANPTSYLYHHPVASPSRPIRQPPQPPPPVVTSSSWGGTLPRSTLNKTPTRPTRHLSNHFHEDNSHALHQNPTLRHQRNERPRSLYNTTTPNDNIQPLITNNNIDTNNLYNIQQQTSPSKYPKHSPSNQLLKFNARTLEMNRNTVTRFNSNNNNHNNNNMVLEEHAKPYWQHENNILTQNNVAKRKPREDAGVAVKKRRNPIQRAASRLYKASEGPVIRKNDCIGPEFVVRASLPAKQLSVGDCKPSLQRNITVILLNGQKLNVICDPNTTTAGEIFQVVIQSENLKENFMLGLSALMSGDFIFLPSDTRVCKVATFGSNQTWSNLTLFLRVRLFLPSLRGIRGYEARHALYLQLRRSILEQQLACNLKTLITISGLALQAEFGDFKEKEHGKTDYFLLEHYVPETMLNESATDTLKSMLIGAHKDRFGCERDRAEQEFIQHAQALPHYGGHFYAANWVTKDSQCNNVWLCVTARGISLYERTSSSPLTSSNISPCQAFEWRSIQTLCYSKQYLCILPHSGGKHSRPTKCKLKMDHKKSYFTFRLASLHHQFFLRLRTEYSSLQTLAQEFGIPLKDVKNETNALCKMNTISNDQDTQFKISYRTSSVSSHASSERDAKQQKCRRSKSATEIRVLDDNMQLEEYQNKENENPQKHFGSLTRDVKTALILDSSLLSGVPNVPSLGRERRQGVLMGTRAIGTSCTFQPSDLMHAAGSTEGSDVMSLYSSSQGESLAHCGSEGEAFVLNSTLRASDEKFLPDFHETISDSLMEKFDKLSFVEERILRSVILARDGVGSLGLQITEGSDGNVYVQSVIPNGPADRCKSIFKGDQIVAVDGQSLLNLRYDDALNMLKRSGKSVEFVLAQFSSQAVNTPAKPKVNRNLYKSCLQLNNQKFDRSRTSFFNSCADISHINEPESPHSSFLSASTFLQNDTVIERNVDVSAINYVDFSDTNFYNSMVPSPNKCGHVVTNPYPLEKNYLKHIRYETAAEIDGIYSNTLSRSNKSQMCSPRISKSCGTLNDPKMFLHDIYSDEPVDNEGRTDEPVVIKMIPKMSKSIENFLYQNASSTYLDDTISLGLSDRTETGKQVAMPRSLGLSRKWKGPVRYPVTPVRYSTNKCSTEGTEDDMSACIVTSDDEQVFI